MFVFSLCTLQVDLVLLFTLVLQIIVFIVLIIIYIHFDLLSGLSLFFSFV